MNDENFKNFKIEFEIRKITSKRQCTWHYGKWQYPFLLQIHNLFTTLSIEKCSRIDHFHEDDFSLWFIKAVTLVFQLGYPSKIAESAMLTRQSWLLKNSVSKIMWMKNVKLVGILNWIMFRTCPAFFNLFNNAFRSP